MRTCPACQLLSSDSAERCDCGYDYTSGSMKASYLSANEQKRILEALSHDQAISVVGWKLGFKGVALVVSAIAITPLQEHFGLGRIQVLMLLSIPAIVLYLIVQRLLQEKADKNRGQDQGKESVPPSLRI
jgi:hypothetical protein